jgi:hypothetical protein
LHDGQCVMPGFDEFAEYYQLIVCIVIWPELNRTARGLDLQAEEGTALMLLGVQPVIHASPPLTSR